MAFEEQLPQWENEGTQPPQTKRTEGWLPNEKPPASWMNWLFGRTYKVLQELRSKVALKTDVEELAGPGRTTETVKGNADALNAHLDDYEQNAVKRDGSVAMDGDLKIDKNAPYVIVEHNAVGNSTNGGFLARNKEQDIWRVGGSSGTGHLNIESFLASVFIRSAHNRWVFSATGLGVEFNIITYDGHPNGAVTAPIGSLCIRTDSGSHGKLYVKNTGTGNTGWLEVATV